jgi:hypothetical protein
MIQESGCWCSSRIQGTTYSCKIAPELQTECGMVPESALNDRSLQERESEVSSLRSAVQVAHDHTIAVSRRLGQS